MSDKILIRDLTFGGVNYGDVVSYKDYNQSQLDLEQANKDKQNYYELHLECERGLLQAEENIVELAEALNEAGKWLTEVDNKYYVRGNCIKELANKYKDK